MDTKLFPWRSVLFAPLASAPAAAVAGLGSSDGGIASDFVWGFFLGVVLGIPAAYLGMVFIGIPAFLVLRKLGLLRLWIFGALGALLPLLIFVGAAPLRTTLMAVAAGAGVGATAYLLLPGRLTSSVTSRVAQ